MIYLLSYLMHVTTTTTAAGDILSVIASAVVLSAVERRVMAAIHRRDGPAVHGILGMLQPVADGLKLMVKSTSGVIPPSWSDHYCWSEGRVAPGSITDWMSSSEVSTVVSSIP